MSLTSYRAAPSRVKCKSPAVSGPDLPGRRHWLRPRGHPAVLAGHVWERHVCKKMSRFGGPGSDLLSRALRRSTIGARGLNDRVRDGIGWGPSAIATGSAETSLIQHVRCDAAMHSPSHMGFTIKPIEQLVPVSSTHRCASTPGLSTWSSSTALKGNLVSRWVSRLDAFSGYPVRT